MQINVGDIFKAIGPGASTIFAAWIFVSFLQVRSDAAVERYLDMIQQFRSKDASDARLGFLKEQILTYRRRCALMNVASSIGLSSAVALVLTLIVGELALVFPEVRTFTWVSIVLAIAGFAMIITATVIVLIEGSVIHRQLEHELQDIPELASEGTAGGSSRPKRKRLGLVR